MGTFLTVLLAGVGTWIAYNQFRIAQANLRLALFDRRFAVFESAREFLVRVGRENVVTMRDIATYSRGILDAHFLFDAAVVAYLQEIRHRALQLHGEDVMLERGPRAGEQKLIDSRWGGMQWLTEQLDELPKRLQPYMAFDEWRLKSPPYVRWIDTARRLIRRKT